MFKVCYGIDLKMCKDSYLETVAKLLVVVGNFIMSQSVTVTLSQTEILNHLRASHGKFTCR